MSSRPIKLPRWADNPGVGDAGRVEPPSGLKDSGWNNGQRPPAGHHNYLWGEVDDFVKFNFQQHLIASWIVGKDGPGAADPNVKINAVVGGFADPAQWRILGDATGTGGELYQSTDGHFLDPVSTPKQFDLYAGVYDVGSGFWVYVGEADGTDAYIVTESIVSLNERTNPKNFDLYAVAGDGSGNLLAAGAWDGSDVYSIKSTNGGASWSEKALISLANSQVNGMCYSPTFGRYFLVGQDGSGNPKIWSTPDGEPPITTHTVDGAATGILRSVCATGKSVVAVGDDSEIHRSDDGSGFDLVHDGTTVDDLLSVAADTGMASGTLIAVSANGGRRIFYSLDDGLTWDVLPHKPSLPDEAADNWQAVAFHKGFLIAGQVAAGFGSPIAARGGSLLD